MLHAAALAYVSDYGSLGVPQRRMGPSFSWERSTSLDHALWLHLPPRFDGWLLMESTSDLAHAGRALTTRTLSLPDGGRVATIGQVSVFATENP